MKQLAKSVKYLLKTKILIASIVFGAIFIGSILLYLCYAFLYLNFNIYCGQFIFNFVWLVFGLMCYIVIISIKNVKYMLLNGVNRKTLIVSRAIVITTYFVVMLLILFGFQAIIVALRSDPMSQFGFWGLINNMYGSSYNLSVIYFYYALALMFCISLVNFVSGLFFGAKDSNIKKGETSTKGAIKKLVLALATTAVILAILYFILFMCFAFAIGSLNFNDYKIAITLFILILYVGSFAWQYFRLKTIAK